MLSPQIQILRELLIRSLAAGRPCLLTSSSLRLILTPLMQSSGQSESCDQGRTENNLKDLDRSHNIRVCTSLFAEPEDAASSGLNDGQMAQEVEGVCG